MRPQVQALITKLRAMKTVQEVGTAEEIIWDLAFHQLHRTGQEVRLASIAARLTALWVGMVKNEKGQPAYIFGQEPPICQHDGVEDASDCPKAEVIPSPSQIKDHLMAPALRDAVQGVIKTHVPKLGSPAWMIKCTCGRDYAHEEEWANHVRVRVYRAIMGEFPAIGTPETSNG